MAGRGHVARKQTSKGVRYYPVVELPPVVDPATGRLKRRQQWHPGYSARKAADKELTRILGQLDHGVYVEPSKLTVETYLKGWLEGMTGKVEPNTLENWGNYARAQVYPRIGHVRLHDLTAARLAAFYGELADRGRRDGKGGLAPKTVKNIHGLLHRALADAVEQALVSRNEAALSSARPAKVPKVERRVWAPEVLRRFLEGMVTDRLAALWHLDCTTGLRRSELLGLPWSALDLDRSELAVVQRLILVNHRPVIRRGTKTPKSARRISLDPVTVAILKAHRRAQAAERLAWGPAWRDHGLVFAHEDGTPLYPNWVTERFERLATDAGLPRLTLHGLRHSYATAGLAAGVDVKVMSERLGHASTGLTADLYQHVLPAMDAAAAARVAGLILGAASGDKP
jgi:integrase